MSIQTQAVVSPKTNTITLACSKGRPPEILPKEPLDKPTVNSDQLPEFTSTLDVLGCIYQRVERDVFSTTPLTNAAGGTVTNISTDSTESDESTTSTKTEQSEDSPPITGADFLNMACSWSITCDLYCPSLESIDLTSDEINFFLALTVQPPIENFNFDNYNSNVLMRDLNLSDVNKKDFEHLSIVRNEIGSENFRKLFHAAHEDSPNSALATSILQKAFADSKLKAIEYEKLAQRRKDEQATQTEEIKNGWFSLSSIAGALKRITPWWK